MTERTLLLIKPDGVERGLVGEILGRVEDKGYKIIALKMLQMDMELAAVHYAEHIGKEFYGRLTNFITAGPLVAAVLEGPDVIAAWRLMQGATDPAVAAPGTIRGDLASANPRNLTHGSDSVESASREIGIFFPELEK
jgi:nucleoside-diphosphate kinase